MALVSLYNASADISESTSVISEAFDSGVRLFHSAGHYGDGLAFELLRSALTGKSESKVCIKIEGNPARLFDGCEGIDTSLRALGRDRIDFVQIVESREDMPNRATMADVFSGLLPGGLLRQRLEEARKAGKFWKLGVEVYNLRYLEAALACDLDFIVADQSLIRHVVPPLAAPEPIRTGIVEFIAIRPLAGGWLTSKYQALNDFALHDHRREWYTAGALARQRVAEVCARHGLSIYSAAMRFLLGRPYPHAIALGVRTVQQLRSALDLSLMVPLEPVVEREFLTLFKQPFDLEPADE